MSYEEKEMLIASLNNMLEASTVYEYRLGSGDYSCKDEYYELLIEISELKEKLGITGGLGL